MDELLKYFPDLSPRQREQFEAMGALYMEWNSKINVVSRKDIDQIYTRHILHSLAVARCAKISSGDRVADVGCGGGFPVIPLAVLMPDVHFTAIDSIGKKIRVVSEISSALGLKNLTPINARIESVEEDFDWIVSRAVTELSRFVGWTWGKTRNGILYLKGGDLAQEIADSGKKVELYNLSDWYSEEFFETKQLLYLPKK
ncbi:MAG: 16S rRNA (guanine(527)-N(7))-methyltransferase RsmG [Rikenellaceae bacterium]